MPETWHGRQLTPTAAGYRGGPAKGGAPGYQPWGGRTCHGRIVRKLGEDVKVERAEDTGRWSSEELLLRAAWYYYKDELTQDEIARRLSMSRASVGRLLDRARRVGLVSINLNTEYLDAFELSGELRKTFGLA